MIRAIGGPVHAAKCAGDESLLVLSSEDVAIIIVSRGGLFKDDEPGRNSKFNPGCVCGRPSVICKGQPRLGDYCLPGADPYSWMLGSVLGVAVAD